MNVLDGVNFALEQGEIVTIMGPSGCGKSTLLNILGTLDSPTEGSLIIADQPIDSLSDREISELRNRTIGFVFQFHHLLPEFTALENVVIPSLVMNQDQPRTARAMELLDYVGLSERADHYPAELSGGERLRVAVTRALINRPNLVMADEPTGNLDLGNASNLIGLFKQINRDFNQSLIITTHNPEVARIGHRQLSLESGRLE